MNEQFLAGLQQVLMILDQRISTLEHTLNDVIIATWKEAAEEEAKVQEEQARIAARKAEIEAFMQRYPQVKEVEAPLSMLYGNDYDVYGDLYDSMSSHVNDDGFNEADYVNGQLADVKDRLYKLQSGEYPLEAAEEGSEISEEQLARELAAVS